MEEDNVSTHYPAVFVSLSSTSSAAVCVHNVRLTRMEKDIASAQHLASGVCKSIVNKKCSSMRVQQSSSAVPCRAVPCHALEWKRTVPLPTTQQCWPICHTAVHGVPIGLEEDSAFANYRVLTNIICHPVVQQRRGTLHNDGPTSASATTQ
jgi:hypothetical protein